jgi:CRISPR-associated endonuclease/helicase Cas3
MQVIEFEPAFKTLTGYEPFPWQQALYQRFLLNEFPSCNLPTGLGKTNVIAIWLIALVNRPDQMPRRLVYVVNRRTVVDQTTTEVENIRKNQPWFPELAISTLRGQFADIRAWSADPSRPAVICGTVDMIGSRLLFSGYGVGFKGKPLHAGFLGQDVLLVHDEAHLEPAFQKLIESIRDEQRKDGSNRVKPFHIMALTATPRDGENTFELTDSEKQPPADLPDPTKPIHYVWHRLCAKKGLGFYPVKRAEIAKTVGETARDRWKSSGKAILVFVRTVEDVATVYSILTDKKTGVPEDQVLVLTGTLRGLERDDMVEKAVFRRFQLKVPSDGRTIFLVCTSAGEVGVDISADHMVCDLTTLDSFAQRLGRVNRRGGGQAEVDLIYESDPDPKHQDKDFEKARWKTLEILGRLARCDWDVSRYDASPLALTNLTLSDADRLAAFAPTPIILPATDILFDAWALTTIRGKLPGRPAVEPYLHGISSWQPPDTHVAWREEVDVVTQDLQKMNRPRDLLEDYPIKPHELLRDRSDRVFDRLKKLKAPPEKAVWILDDAGSVEVTTLGQLTQKDKSFLEYKTILLPPSAGGLKNGFLSSDSMNANDVADEWKDENGLPRRVRIWDENPVPEDARNIRTIDTKPEVEESETDELAGRRFWSWYELRNAGDSDRSKSNRKPVLWQVHTDDVVKNVQAMVAELPLPDGMKPAMILAAKFHDLGKQRCLFQKILGNLDSTRLLAKSGKKTGFVPEQFRHEFASLIDVLAGKVNDTQHEVEFKRLDPELQDLILHLIAVHHGYGRPHFPQELAFDPDPKGQDAAEIAAAVPQRFARLQRKFGRWGLAYLESLLRAADWAASAKPSKEEDK